jgi:hypothetical protein
VMVWNSRQMGLARRISTWSTSARSSPNT